MIEAGLKSPFWQEMERLLQGQIMARRQQLFGLQFSGLDNCFVAARLQGETAGLSMAIALPQIVLNDLAQDLEIALAEERQEEKDV